MTKEFLQHIANAHSEWLKHFYEVQRQIIMQSPKKDKDLIQVTFSNMEIGEAFLNDVIEAYEIIEEGIHNQIKRNGNIYPVETEEAPVIQWHSKLKKT